MAMLSTSILLVVAFNFHIPKLMHVKDISLKVRVVSERDVSLCIGGPGRRARTGPLRTSLTAGITQ